jgi:hypothetical protein
VTVNVWVPVVPEVHSGAQAVLVTVTVVPARGGLPGLRGGLGGGRGAARGRERGDHDGEVGEPGGDLLLMRCVVAESLHV